MCIRIICIRRRDLWELMSTTMMNLMILMMKPDEAGNNNVSGMTLHLKKCKAQQRM